MAAWLIARAIFIAAAPFLAGCSAPDAPRFRLNTEGRDPAEIRPARKEAILDALEQLFGTPDEPKVPEGGDLQRELLQMAAGPIGSDAQGNQWGLYRQHCAECHGLSGDGAGPAAAVLNPYPRDFRNGLFKYTRTTYGAKPVWEDLDWALRRGNPGTSMPSFDTLPGREIAALIEYVKYLSIRGQTELYLLELEEDEYDPLDMDRVIEEGVLWTAGLWGEAGGQVVAAPRPPPTDTPRRLAASVATGRAFFLSENAKCYQCHGPEGRGNGEQSALYDDWNKEKINKDPSWFQLPLQRLRPRDFTQGIFRGGDRPIDIYWRVHTGINGTPMPPAGPGPGSAGAFTAEEIWHLVHYVRSLAKLKTP